MVEFRDFDPNNENKIWWLDFLKAGNVHSFAGDPAIENCLKNDTFGDLTKEDGQQVLWLDDVDVRGPLLFSFDGEIVYEYYRDYPQNLTVEQKEIFDKENPELMRC